MLGLLLLPQLIYMVSYEGWSCGPTTHDLSHKQIVTKVVEKVIVLAFFH